MFESRRRNFAVRAPGDYRPLLALHALPNMLERLPFTGRGATIPAASSPDALTAAVLFSGPKLSKSELRLPGTELRPSREPIVRGTDSTLF